MARIDTFFEAFIEERRQSGLGPAGEAYFRDAWATFRRQPGSHRPTWETVRLLRLQGAGTGQDVLWRRVRALHPILTFLQAQKAIAQLPLPSKPLPRRVEGRPAMTEQEVADLVQAISDLGVRVLAALVYFTGIQAGRLIWLRPEHIDAPICTLHVPDGQATRAAPLSRDAVEVLRQWQIGRSHRAEYLLHDDEGRPLTLGYASAVLREAGRRVGRPAVGFGHLQYAHTLLLARSIPQLSQNLLELRMQQSFRLRYLRIPNLYDDPEKLRLPPSYLSPAEQVFKGEDP